MAEGGNCWDIMNCGSEKDCPAYPDNGKTCFSVAKTLCKGEVQGTYEQKIQNCRVCQVYDKLMAGV
jgi:methyl-accepting chemotaxis protein